MLFFKVLAECRRKFPDYTFLGDSAIAKSASVSNRYNANSLHGIIVDIYMLSQTDYLVGTFSSQVSYTIQLFIRLDRCDKPSFDTLHVTF